MFIYCMSQYCSDINSPQIDLWFQCNIIQNPYIFIICKDELDKLILKYVWVVKGPRIMKKHLKNKIKELLDFKTYY